MAVSLRKVDFLIWSVFFLFVFSIPKSGTKVGAVPFYFGILAVGLFIFMNLKFYKPIFLIDLLPYWSIIGIVFTLLFYKNNIDLEIIIRYFVGFAVAPIVANILYNKKVDLKSLTYLIFITGLIPIIYGLFQLIFGMDRIALSGVTVNAKQLADYNYNFYKLMESKCNRVGEYYKLVSTYQNGNLFGLFLVGFYPLLVSLEKTALKKFVYVIEVLTFVLIFRTLSRTAIFTFVIIFFVKLIWGIYIQKNIKVIDIMSKIFLLLVVSLLLNKISKEGFFIPIFQRLFGASSEEVLTLNNRMVSDKLPSLGLRIIFENPLYSHESFYFVVIFSLGIIMGGIVLFTLLYIDYQILLYRRKIFSNPLYFSYILAFVAFQIAGIADLAWGLFPIETQFWIYFAISLVILKECEANLLPISLNKINIIEKLIIKRNLNSLR